MLRFNLSARGDDFGDVPLWIRLESKGSNRGAGDIPLPYIEPLLLYRVDDALLSNVTNPERFTVKENRIHLSLKVIAIIGVIIIGSLITAAASLGAFKTDCRSETVEATTLFMWTNSRDFPDDTLGDDENIDVEWEGHESPEEQPLSNEERLEQARASETVRADGDRRTASSVGVFGPAFTESLRRSTSTRRSSRGFSRPGGQESPDEDDQTYADIREYLADSDEEIINVRDVSEIFGNPSNIVSEGGRVRLVSWDVREDNPQGSYLYVLQPDGANNITQVHRYFCPERRLDILAENCVPIASVYSDAGVPVAVDYLEDGRPVENDADDLDPTLFSGGNTYVEANELLIQLQEYFASLRA